MHTKIFNLAHKKQPLNLCTFAETNTLYFYFYAIANKILNFRSSPDWPCEHARYASIVDHVRHGRMESIKVYKTIDSLNCLEVQMREEGTHKRKRDDSNLIGSVVAFDDTMAIVKWEGDTETKWHRISFNEDGERKSLNLDLGRDVKLWRGMVLSRGPTPKNRKFILSATDIENNRSQYFSLEAKLPRRRIEDHFDVATRIFCTEDYEVIAFVDLLPWTLMFFHCGGTSVELLKKERLVPQWLDHEWCRAVLTSSRLGLDGNGALVFTFLEPVGEEEFSEEEEDYEAVLEKRRRRMQEIHR